MATIHSTPAGSAGVTFPLVPDTDQTEEVGTDALRFLGHHARLGVFVGSSTSTGTVDTGGTRSFGANPTGIVAGNQVENSTGAATHYLAGGAYKAVGVIGNAYAGGTGDATLSTGGGGSITFGSAFSSGAGNAIVSTTGFGSFTSAYAYAGGNNHTWTNAASGCTMVGYSSGPGTVVVQSYAGTGGGAAGAFVAVRARALGTSTCNVLVTANGDGSFVQGQPTTNSTNVDSWTASARGSFLQGSSLNGTFLSSGSGSFCQGFGYDGDITASGVGAMARGYANGGYLISATGDGSVAMGDSANGAITAGASNAFQFGVGVNNTADSLQVGADFVAKANGQHGGANDSLTLGAAATTFVATSNVMTITGDAGANTIATITGGVDGQPLYLIFVDANVTITDNNAHAADSVDLSAAFTSADDTVLHLIYDGTSWYEVSRSVN